jgi:nicotinate phosphoribosyltransferase
MQNAVLRHFPDAHVTIKFTNRAPHMLFSRECFDWVQEHVHRALRLALIFQKRLISGLGELKLTNEEREALAKACPYFPESYLDYLAQLTLHPKEQVRMQFVPKGQDEKLGEMGEIECLIEGVWTECILYEVPIMSIRAYGF